MFESAVMVDSVSQTYGDRTGLTFCGARSYSCVPSNVCTDPDEAGRFYLNPTDPTLEGKSVAVIVTGTLADYPTITSTVSFSVTINLLSCLDVILTPPSSSDLKNDVYYTT